MLHLQTFTFNPFQENTYLITNEKNQCWIVDPGMFDEKEKTHFFNYIAEHKLSPQAIINTHAHIDHIFGVQACMDEYNIPFYLHEKELPVLNGAVSSAQMFGIPFSQSPQPTSFIEENKPLDLNGETLEVRFAPGHSPGSVVFYYEPGKWVIGGDVLFNGSIGRTDLPGGNFNTLIESIRTQLFTLPDETIVHSGHGPSTTIEREKMYNPFLQ